jgi:hypothetical protein
MKHLRLAIALLIAAAPVLSCGQTKGAIKQAIEAKYPPAQVNDEGNDLTAAGAVIDLLKDDLLLSTTTSLGTDGDGNSLSRPKPMSIYKNGKFQRSTFSKLMSGSNYRSLVAGDKCWLIGIDIKDDGAVLEFLSDPINGVRFKGSAKYPFPKGQIPAADAVLQQIAENSARLCSCGWFCSNNDGRHPSTATADRRRSRGTEEHLAWPDEGPGHRDLRSSN